MGMQKLTHTFSILSYIRTVIDNSHPLPAGDISFSDMSYTAEGARLLVTDIDSGDEYELLLRPTTMAESDGFIPRTFGEAQEER